MRLNVSTHVILERLTPRLDEVDIRTRPAEGGAREGTVVASPDTIPVERGGAIRHRSGPFTDHEPFIAVLGVGGDVVADELSVFVGLHGGEVVVEDLIFVMVYDDILGVVVCGTEESVPALWGGEPVVEDDRGAAYFPNVVEALAVILFGGGTAAGNVGEKGFVEELDGDDDILVRLDSVFVGNLGYDIVGEGGGVARCPFGSAGSLAGVVETVLRERCSYKTISLMLRRSPSDTHHVNQSRPLDQSAEPIQWLCQDSLVLP